MENGILYWRRTPTGPPSMQKVYGVLWGTLLSFYKHGEGIANDMIPLHTFEVVGVSKWEKPGRSNQCHTFLVVTHSGANVYLSVSSKEEQDRWMIALRLGLECSLSNALLAPYKPCNNMMARPSASSCSTPTGTVSSTATLTAGMVTNIPVTSSSCQSCGRNSSTVEIRDGSVPLIQFGAEDGCRICVPCSAAQTIVLWCKSMNYMHLLTAHELCPDVVSKPVSQFPHTFSAKRVTSERLTMAAQLRESGSITEEEFEELRSVDHAYRREQRYQCTTKLRALVDYFSGDVLALISLITPSAVKSYNSANPDPNQTSVDEPSAAAIASVSPSTTATNDATRKAMRSMAAIIETRDILMVKDAFNVVIYRLLEVADTRPELVDFFFPQLMAAHSELTSNSTDPVSMACVDCLQQALIVLAYRHEALASRLLWSLSAVAEDYETARVNGSSGVGVVTGSQYAAAMSLLFQTEMVVTGCVSCLADVPASRTLSSVVTPAPAQQSVLAIELSALFLVRRHLQESLDEDEKRRQMRHVPLEGQVGVATPNSSFSLNECKSPCVSLLKQLGVGQAPIDMTPSRRDRKRRTKNHTSHRKSLSDVCEQLDFVARLNTIVDSLKAKRRCERLGVFTERVVRWNSGSVRTSSKASKKYSTENREEVTATEKISSSAPNSPKIATPSPDDVSVETLLRHNTSLGWDPTVVAGEPAYRIVRIVPSECRVFRTKARAPTLVCAEVLRDDVFRAALKHLDRGADVESTETVGDESQLNTPVINSGSLRRLDDAPAIAAAVSEAIFSCEASSTDESLPTVHSQSESSSPPLPPTNSDLGESGCVKQGSAAVLVRNRKSGSIVSAARFSKHTAEVLRGEEAAGSAHVGTRMRKNYSSTFSTESSDDLILSAGIDSNSSAVLTGTDGVLSTEATAGAVTAQQTAMAEKTRARLATSAKTISDSFGELFVARRERLLDNPLREWLIEQGFITRTSRVVRSNTTTKDDANCVNNGPEQAVWPVQDIRWFIVKTSDDLRQEVMCMQVMVMMREVFRHFDLADRLYLRPYRVLSTGASTGLVQVLSDAVSLDALKRTPGFTNLSAFFKRAFGSTAGRLARAKRAFVSSLAAYSLFSYLLQVKDRHNGNVLLDASGRILHIDFGFVLSIAPGGRFSFESAPFKLTEEMVELMGGLQSPLFTTFVESFTMGFIALQANCDALLNTVDALRTSAFPCFNGRIASATVIEKLRSRFKREFSVKDVRKHCLDLIMASYNHIGTRQYDNFQYMTNGIII